MLGDIPPKYGAFSKLIANLPPNCSLVWSSLCWEVRSATGLSKRNGAKLRELTSNFPKLADWLCMSWPSCWLHRGGKFQTCRNNFSHLCTSRDCYSIIFKIEWDAVVIPAAALSFPLLVSSSWGGQCTARRPTRAGLSWSRRDESTVGSGAGGCGTRSLQGIQTFLLLFILLIFCWA